MALHRSVSVQTEPEDDDEMLEAIGIHREASSQSQNIFSKLRSSLSGSNKKERKQKFQQYSLGIAKLRDKLNEMERMEQVLAWRMGEVLTNNPFNVYITGECRNVQLGANCTINDGCANQDMVDAVADLEELTTKLTTAFQESAKERIYIENKLRDSELLLKELKDSLKVCNTRLADMDDNTNDHFHQVRALLSCLTADRSDKNVITQGMAYLESLVITKGMLVTTCDNLSLQGKEMITRLVNKYGKLKSKEFAEILGIRESSIRFRHEGRDGWMSEDLLGPDMCVRILVQYLKHSTDHSCDKLLNMLQAYEAKKTDEKAKALQDESIKNHHGALTKDQEQRHSERSSVYSEVSDGSSGWNMRRAPSQMLPDARTQFEHQLQSWNLQLEMNGKLDAIMRLMQDATSSKSTTKWKERKGFDLYTFDEGQFV